MGINIGIDIGAIALKLAAVGANADRQLLEGLCRPQAGFRLVPGSRLPLVVSEYVRIAGSPLEATHDLLKAFYETVPEEQVEGLRVTGSGSRTIARLLGIYFENASKAAARGVSWLHPGTRTVIEIGGETSSYLCLDPDDENGLILDYDRGGDCAAGTGSFLDQQSARLGYSVDEMSGVVASATTAARIAGRCSVFAKSDMIHAQQKGCSPAEILRGLCRAVAQNYKSSVLKGRTATGPALFLGGVAANTGVVEALREALGLDASSLRVPPFAAWCGAIGAALLEADEPRKRSFGEIHRLRQHAGERRAVDTKRLTLDNVVLLRDRVAPPRRRPGPLRGFIGIDVGSVSTNLVATDDDGNVLFDRYLRTAGRPVDAVQEGLRDLEADWGGRLEVLGVGTTGSGRELVAEFVGADVVNDEITAHKTGAVHVSIAQGNPLVDTIFEIGGQDSKFISLEGGVVVDFAMNEACAAGTGSFLEEQAEKLGISIKEEFARLALSGASPTRLGERCTVFMERDVTTWLQRGEPLPCVVAGLAYSIALNYLNRVVRGRRIGDVIYFQGGTAYNDAVAAAFAAILGKTITVPPYNGVIGAIGMALIARDRWQAVRQPTRFRGYDLSRLERRSRDFVCRACANECSIREFTIDGQKSFWGDKCSDRYRKPSRAARRPVIEDLIEYRERLFEEVAGVSPGTSAVMTRASGLKVGLPRAMSTVERYPFWHTYLACIGVHPVLSRATDGGLATEGIELAPAQPCYPVQVAHGHVSSLFDTGVDYVLVPNLLDNESNAASSCIAHFCPWTQTLPYVLRSAPRLEPVGSRILAPSLHFQMGDERVKAELRPLAARLGAGRRTSDRAADQAFAAQRRFQEAQLEAGRRALAILDETREPGLVLLGRPYNIYDRAINCDIPRKLRKYYGANVLPMDFLVTGRELKDAPGANMYWTSGRRMLEAARLVASRPNLHIVYITNFKCGPDSYIKHYTRQAAGAPLLVLQFDGHGNDAGYLTRCEAFLDSKGILRCHAGDATATPERSTTL